MDNKRSLLDLFLEKTIWFLVLAVFILGPAATGLVRSQDFVYAAWLIVGGVAVWGVRILFVPQYRVFWPPICYSVLAFVGYAIWQYTQAPIEYVARQELLRVLVYAGLFFLILNNLNRQEAAQWMSFTLIVVAMLISFYAIYQSLTKSEKVWHFIRPHGYEGRASGTYINPNHLAGFLEMVLPISISMLLSARLSVLVKVFLGYAALVMLTALALTISRAGWGAAAVGLAFMIAYMLFQMEEGLSVPLIAGGVLAVIAAGLFFVARQVDSGQNRLTSVRTTYDVRYRIWPAALSIWKENVWFGGGPDHFDYRFPKYREASDQLVGHPGRVHNDYYNTLADWGLVGFGLIASAFGFLGYGFIRGWKYLQRTSNELGKTPKSTRAAIALGALSGLVAILAHSVFDFNMHIPANAMTAVSFMALISCFLRFSSERYWLTGAWWMRLAIVLPVVGWLYYMSLQMQKLTLESRALADVASRKVDDQTRLDHLQRAFAIDDKNDRTAQLIGEHFWQDSKEGGTGYEEMAKQAIGWFEKAVQLNPFNHVALVRYGMCLDWLDRHKEAEPYFKRAVDLDPNGYDTVNHMGWHLFQVESYVEARKWFEKSAGLYWQENPMAYTYIKIIDKKLGATTPLPTPPPSSKGKPGAGSDSDGSSTPTPPVDPAGNTPKPA